MRALFLVLGLVLGACGAGARGPLDARGDGAHGERLLFRDDFTAAGVPVSLARAGDLTRRQAGVLAPAPWSTTSGVWFDAPPADDGTARLLAADAEEPGGLVFRGFTAVRLEAPIVLSPSASYRIVATLDPVLGDEASLGWVSISLTPSHVSSGWVTAPEMLLGLLVRSSGAIQVFSREVEVPTPFREGLASPRALHEVELRLTPLPEADPPGWRVLGRVDANRFAGELAGANPDEPVYLHLGAHFHPGDLEASRVRSVAIYETR